MLRIFLALVALPVLWLAGRAVVLALVSDETRIRWQVEDMLAGYNEGDVGDAVAPLHRDWRHEGHELDRDLLRAGLAREFFQDRNPRTKRIERRAALAPDSLLVRVDGDAAEVETIARFERAEGDDASTWRLVWEARIEANLVRTGEGWRILATRHEDLGGTQLSR